jgi:hypothetical protein
MLAVLRSRAILLFLAVIGTAAIGFGCSAILSLGDYEVGTNDASIPSEAGDAGDAGGDADICANPDASATFDFTKACWPCAADETAEYLNACTGGDCVQFDQQRIQTLLLADGGLPPIPVDGGN